MPRPPDDYLKPICPLRDKSDMDRHLPIGEVDELFAAFKKFFDERAAWTDYGHLFVVTGEKGYGKTSLIQRCASWLEADASSKNYCRIVPVDLSDSRWTRKPGGDPPDLNNRMYRTLDRVLGRLEALNLLDVGRRADITNRYSPERSRDCSEGFHELGEILSSRRDTSGLHIVVPVLLQGYPTPDEVVAYYNAAEKGMMFFAELFEERDIDRLVGDWRELNRIEIIAHRIALNELKAGDFRKIADWIRGHEGSWPTIPESIISYVEQEYISSDAGAGMIELVRLVWGALKMARAAGVSEVTQDHIIKYYRMRDRRGAI